MPKKKLRDLCATDLGAAVRYEFGGDSVLEGTLQSVSHAIAFTNINIDGVRPTPSPMDSLIHIYTVEEVRAEQENNPEA